MTKLQLSAARQPRSAAAANCLTSAVLGVFLFAGVGSAWAEPFPASVEVDLRGSAWSCGIYVCPTHLSAPLGPLLAGASPVSGHYAGAWTDYGSNGAGVSMWATKPSGAPGTGNAGWIEASSKWTDLLMISTPDAAEGAPVDLVFTIGLHGHMEANRTSYVSLGGQARFTMEGNHDGTWIEQPSLLRQFWADTGGDYAFHDEIDIDEVQQGRLRVHNGQVFNLMATLSTHISGDFWGPWDTSFNAEVDLGNTVRWLGADVWIGDTKATSWRITSESGYDYGAGGPPRDIPEPTALTLAAIGLFCLAGLRRRERAQPRRLVAA